MPAAIGMEIGCILRTTSGASAGLEINAKHPDTSQPIVGTKIPHWEQVVEIVDAAAPVFAGIRTSPGMSP